MMKNMFGIKIYFALSGLGGPLRGAHLGLRPRLHYFAPFGADGFFCRSGLGGLLRGAHLGLHPRLHYFAPIGADGVVRRRFDILRQDQTAAVRRRI